MSDQIQRELDYQRYADTALYEHRIDLLRRTLMGFATNATDCLACRMSNECATEALERDALLAKGG